MDKKIVWAEGVLLGQQHLQQWDNAHQAQQKLLTSAIAPLSWGLISLEIDKSKLKEDRLCITSCQAIYAEGIAIQYDANDGEELNCKLSPVQDGGSIIYLCLPLNQHVKGINGYKQPQQNPAWTAHYQNIKDIYDPEREREIMFCRANLSLKQDENNEDNYYTLPIARIFQDEAKKYVLDNKFFPVATNIKAARLGDILAQLLKEVTQRITQLKTPYPDPDEAIKLLLLQTLSTGHCQIKHLLEQQHTHPELAFITLAETASKLRVLQEDFKFENSPLYKHEDLTKCFGALYDYLLGLINLTAPTRMEHLKLRREGNSLYMADSIDPGILEHSYFYLAVYHQSDSTSWIGDLARQIKIGAQSQIHQLIAAAMPGLVVQHVQRTPDKLTIKPGYEYFFIDAAGEFWQQICADKNLAIFVPDDFKDIKIDLINIAKG